MNKNSNDGSGVLNTHKLYIVNKKCYRNSCVTKLYKCNVNKN